MGKDERRAKESADVAPACDSGAAPIRPLLRISGEQVHATEKALEPEQHLTAARHDFHGTVPVPDCVIDPAGQATLGCQHVQGRQPR
ncbi:hypothetical protein, partial [Mycobacterium sp.]|uniref:hypothetical protein n=1 Tax=Mycobacterium sp. TaxID=1785 RepID=UPI0028BDA69C